MGDFPIEMLGESVGLGDETTDVVTGQTGNHQATLPQAGRCMDCGVPFRHAGCPLGNLIPEWNGVLARPVLRQLGCGCPKSCVCLLTWCFAAVTGAA